MGELRKLSYHYCTACHKQAAPACRTAGHPFERREWPTWQIRYYRDGKRYEESSGSDKESVAR